MVRLILIFLYTFCINLTYEPSKEDLEFYTKINNYREDNNIPRLQWSTELYLLAQDKTKHMIEFDYFGHTSPAGLDLRTRMLNTHGKAENLATGYTTVDDALQALKDSPTHNFNLIDARSTKVGIYTEDKITTQIFGDDTLYEEY